MSRVEYNGESFDELQSYDLTNDIASMWAVKTAELEEELQEREAQNNKRIEQSKKLGELIGVLGSQGLKVSSVLGVVNPQLGLLAKQVESVGTFTVDTVNKLQELVNSLSNLGSSMQILGLSTAELEGASEVADQLNKLSTAFSDFILSTEKAITSLFDGDWTNDDKKLIEKIFKNAYTVANPISLGLVEGYVVGTGTKKELNPENDLSKLVGVNDASDILNNAIYNINSQGIMSEQSLIKLSSGLFGSFRGNGLLDSDANIYTSQILGYSNKLWNELGLTDPNQYSAMANAIGKFALTGKNSGLGNFGLGIDENYLYGYAQSLGKNYNTLSSSEQFSTAMNAFDSYINSTDEARLAMQKLGAEVRSNTTAIQSWQYLETIGGKSTEYVGADTNNFLAVNENNEDITDAIFGSEEDRKELIDANNELIQKAENIYNVLVNQNNNSIRTVDEWVKYNAELAGLDANIVNPPEYNPNTIGSLDSVIAQNSLGLNTVTESNTINRANATWTQAVDVLKNHVNTELGKVNIDINTSPLFDVMVEDKVLNWMWNVQQKAYNKRQGG